MTYRRQITAAVLATGALLGAGAPPARAQADAAAPQVVLPLPATPPKGAVVLFSGKADELKRNWLKRYSTEPANWLVGKDGVLSPQRSDIVTREQYGDFYLHVEFRCPTPGPDGKKIGGNAGVGLQGRYEVQIYGSYGDTPESHNAAALYSQTPARVIASRPSGQWESYDIVFRAPRFDASGAVTEKPRATVFQNGILVQNNTEFTGMTGIQYGEFKTMAPTGPIVLQGDHDPVQFRNIWIVPL